MDSNKAKYNKLIEKAKELGRQGQLEQALGLFEKAYKIHQSEKLGRKIEKLKVLLFSAIGQQWCFLGGGGCDLILSSRLRKSFSRGGPSLVSEFV